VPVDRLVSLLADPVITPLPVRTTAPTGFATGLLAPAGCPSQPGAASRDAAVTQAGKPTVDAGLTRLAADLQSGR